MIIQVISRGANLRKRDGHIVVSLGNELIQDISPSVVEAMVLSAPCMLSSELISLCMEADISITQVDWRGIPLWRIEPFQGGSIPLLRRRQLLLADHPAGVLLSKTLLSLKLKNRVRYLRRLAQSRPDKRGDTLLLRSKQIEELAEKIESISGVIGQRRQTLLGYEGSAGHIYFSALASLLPKEAEFTGRDRGCEAGPFNLMLNYGYGMLYQDIPSLCGHARLDPYIGVMHTDGYNRPTLIYDLAEPFRVSIEQAVFTLFSRRRVCPEAHFISHENGLQLSPGGKALLVEAVYRVQGKTIREKMERLVNGLAKGLSNWNPKEVRP